MSLCNDNIFKSTFQKWQKALQLFVQSRGFEKDIAANITQDAFVRLWKNCSSVKLETVKSYLFTICNNLMIDQHRSNKVRLSYRAELTTKELKEDPQFQLEQKEFKQRLETVLSAMPPKQKEVFMLSRFADLSYKEIAEQLDLSVKAIEKRMAQALLYLAKQKIIKKK